MNPVTQRRVTQALKKYAIARSEFVSSVKVRSGPERMGDDGCTSPTHGPAHASPPPSPPARRPASQLLASRPPPAAAARPRTPSTPPTHPRSLQDLLQGDHDRVALTSLIDGDVMALLCCPLTSDPAPAVRASALTALASLCAREAVLSDAFVSSGALETIADAMSDDAGPVQVRRAREASALHRSGRSARHSAAANHAARARLRRSARTSRVQPSRHPHIPLRAAAAAVQVAADAVVQALARSPAHAPALIEAGVGGRLLQQLDSGEACTVEAAVHAINALCAASPRLAGEFVGDHTLALLVGGSGRRCGPVNAIPVTGLRTRSCLTALRVWCGVAWRGLAERSVSRPHAWQGRLRDPAGGAATLAEQRRRPPAGGVDHAHHHWRPGSRRGRRRHAGESGGGEGRDDCARRPGGEQQAQQRGGGDAGRKAHRHRRDSCRCVARRV